MASEEALAAKQRGNGFFKKRDYDNAIIHYSQAIELEPAGPTSHTFFSNRSACYAGKENFELALADAEECIKIKPDYAKGYSRKGYALFKLRRFEDAEEAYKAGLGVDPNNASLKEGLAETERAQSGGNRGGGGMFGDNIWMLIHSDPELREMAKDQQFIQKVQMLQSGGPQMLQLFQNDPQIRVLLTKMLGGMGGMDFSGPPPSATEQEPPEARTRSPPPTSSRTSQEDKDDDGEAPSADASEAEEKAPPKQPTPEPEEPVDPELLARQQEAAREKERGTELYKAKDFDEALAAYRRAADLDPAKPVYLLNQSAVLFMQQHWEECLDTCRAAIECANTNLPGRQRAEWLYKANKRMGDVEEKRGGEMELIERYYNNALLEKTDNKLRDKIKKLKRKRKAQAEKDYFDEEKALEHKARGNEHFKANRNQEAIEEYTESIKRNPNDSKVYSNRAIAFCKMMAWGEALADCDKAISLEPDFIKPWIRKAKIFNAIHQYHKAVKALQIASKIDGSNRDVLETKAQTMQAVQRRNASGEMDEAMRQRALEDEEVKEAMNDAEVSSVLVQARADPSVLMKAMRDRPHIAEKIEVLMAAGVLMMG